MYEHLDTYSILFYQTLRKISNAIDCRFQLIRFSSIKYPFHENNFKT